MLLEDGPSLEKGNIAGVLMLSSHEAAFVALKDNQVAIPEPKLENFVVEEPLIVRPTSLCALSVLSHVKSLHLFSS